MNKYWEEFLLWARDENERRHADWERRVEARVAELNARPWYKQIFAVFPELQALGDVSFYKEIKPTIEDYMSYCSGKGYTL